MVGGKSQRLGVGESRVPLLRRWGEVWGQVSGWIAVLRLYLNEVLTGQRLVGKLEFAIFLGVRTCDLAVDAGGGAGVC